MADFHAYKHFYSIATGFSTNVEGFYQVWEHLLKQIKELENAGTIKVFDMMDGIAFYKAYGVAASASNVTKHRGVVANVKENPDLLPCNARREKRRIKLRSILNTGEWNSIEITCNDKNCTCYDWDIFNVYNFI